MVDISSFSFAVNELIRGKKQGASVDFEVYTDTSCYLWTSMYVELHLK